MWIVRTIFMDSWELLQRSWIKMVVSCFAMFACQQLCMLITRKTMGSTGFRALIIPFVFLHEISHYIMAQFFNFKEIRLTMHVQPKRDPSGILGSVTYLAPKNIRGAVGMTMTSLAPLIFGILFLYLLMGMTDVTYLYKDQSIFYIINQVMTVCVATFMDANILLGALFLYLFCGVSIAMSPSLQDYKMCFSGALVLIATLMIIIGATASLNESWLQTIIENVQVISNILVVGTIFTFIATLLTFLMQICILAMKMSTRDWG